MNENLFTELNKIGIEFNIKHADNFFKMLHLTFKFQLFSLKN